MPSSELFNKAVSKVEQVIDSPSTTESLYKKYEALPLTQQLALSMTPGIGETISAYETPKFAGEAKKSFDKGEYLEATGKTAMAGLSALGAIPFLGTGVRAVKGGIKAATKMDEIGEGLSRMRSDYTPSPIVDETTDVLTALGKTEDDIVKFRQPKSKGGQKLEGSEKEVYRNPELEEQAIALDEGLITLGEFKEARDILKPRRTYGTVPKLYENFDIIGSLPGAKGKEYGIVGVNKNLKSGELVSSRFDIPAYRDYGRYVVTIRKGNELFGYAPTAILKNVKFTGNPNASKFSKIKDPGKKSFNIAKGGGKGPFAVMEGKWQNMSPESTHKYAEDLMDAGKVNKYGETGKEWTEIGFDPASKSSFYNRSTGEPIFAADKVVQVGPMLLARGIKKPTKEQLKSLEFTTKAGKKIKGYKEGGQVMPMQYGGGLSDAYSTLSDRRRNQNMYGMGDAPMQQMPSQMSSVFQDPMEASAFSPVNMEQGGDIVVPQERMINDQPHELSYINPQEAVLLKALGGSGRRVDGIPAYYIDDADDSTIGGLQDAYGDFPTDDSGNDAPKVAPQVARIVERQVSQPKDDSENTLFEKTYQGQRGNALGFDTREGFKQDIKNALENELIDAGVKNVDEAVAEMMGKSLGTVAAGSLTGVGGLGTYLDKQDEDTENALQSIIEKLKGEDKVVGKDKGFYGNIKDKIASVFTNDLVGKMANSPEVRAEMAKRGDDFRGYDKFDTPSLMVAGLNAGLMQAPVGVMKAALSFITGSEVVGTFTDPLTGQMMALDTLGKTTFISPDALTSGGPDESGNDQIKEEVIKDPIDKPVVVEEDEKSPMSKLLAQRINNASTIDPNVKIIMDIYGISQEEAQEFLGKKGVGTGSASEFEGI